MMIEQIETMFRVRQLLISYFLEDGTILITEPRMENSGLMQGPFLKRHRIPTPDRRGFLSPCDIYSGVNLDIYGRRIRVTSMDDFTRNFYSDSGLPLGQDEDMPDDAFILHLKIDEENKHRPLPEEIIRQKALTHVFCGGSVINRGTRQFLQYDGQVLNFELSWDNRKFYLNYFPSDDSIEIIEDSHLSKANFLKRIKLNLKLTDLIQNEYEIS